MSGEESAQFSSGQVGLDRVVDLLGADAFLVPCEWGTKKPLVTYVERPFEGTKSPAYRALFENELSAHEPRRAGARAGGRY